MQSGTTDKAVKSTAESQSASTAAAGKTRGRQVLESLAARIPKTPFLIPALIFAFAFALRYLYNAVFMEHRIAHFGDAYNFLRSGSCLLEAAKSSHNPLEFISKIYHAAAPQAQLLQSMTSLKLTDRLMIDGPVFPAYLALVEFLAGVNPFNPIFDSHTVFICLCNSVLDALSCVLVYACGRLAFNRRVAICAALIFSIYPAAIINTQHCYSEPFSYFLLNAWTALVLYVLLRHVKASKTIAAAWCGIGLLTGLMMLSKPAFILLPPLVTAALVPVSIFRQIAERRKPSPPSASPGLSEVAGKYAKRAAFAFVGLALVLTPWVFFNKVVSGQYSVFVNRVPSFNIFHGNQIATDAWRCYPFYGCFPGDSKLVIASLAADARQQPVIFAGLQFKKIARLWSGVWNEYHYSLFGIPLEAQSLFHQLLLLSAALSLSYLLFRSSASKPLSRSFAAALVLGTIVLFHFAYIPFEAISRYAISAMPAICLLSAVLIIESWKQKPARLALLCLFAIAAPAFLLVSASGITANFIAAFLPESLLQASPFLSTFVAWTALFLCVIFGARLLATLTAKSVLPPSMLLIPAATALLAGATAAFYTIQSYDWSEWQCSLNSKQSINQTILIPEVSALQKTADNSCAFVLIDLSSETLSPPLNIKLNGKTLPEQPVPLAQFQANNSDILQCLAIQGEGMELDLRTFRNWWVVPCLAADMHSGANVIELSCADDNAKMVVYGDFRKPKTTSTTDGATFLPSLRSFSYTKGFTTFDHRDPRVFEKEDLQGKAVASRRITNAEPSTKDLSDSSGTQYGSYRIRLMVPTSTASNSSTKGLHAGTSNAVNQGARSKLIQAPIILINGAKPHEVSGQDPATFVPAIKVIDLPAGLPEGLRFSFDCHIRNLNGTRPYFVSLTFTGLDRENIEHSWSSKWQPIAIPSSRTLKQTSFTDTIPSEVLSLRHLQIHPLFSPFQPDFLFLKHRQAVRNRIEIHDAELTFHEPLNLPPLDSRQWVVY